MNGFLKKIKNNAEFISMILFFCAAAFTLLYHLQGFGGGFMPVMGNLVTMLLYVALWLSYPLFVALGKKQAAKCVIKPVAVFWFLSFVFSLLGDSFWATKGNLGVGIAAGIFSFLIGCALIALSIIGGVAWHKKEESKKKLILIFSCAILCFLLILFALTVAYYATNEFAFANWNDYFGILTDDVVLPFAMFFVMIHYLYKEKDMEILKEQPTKEKVAEEPVPEMNPAEKEEGEGSEAPTEN